MAERRCRECGRPESKDLEFKPNANICKPCNIEYMKEYRRINRKRISRQVRDWKDKNREQYRASCRTHYATADGKKKHRGRVEKTPRTWLSHILSMIRSRCKKPGPHDAKKGPKRDFDLDLDFLMRLHGDQDGCCALSGLPMVHEFNSMRSISIDRVDSGKGYTRDNVQLVCQALNHAKRHHSNEDMIDFLIAFREDVRVTDLKVTNTVTRAGGRPILEHLGDVNKVVLGLARRVQKRYWLKGWKITVDMFNNEFLVEGMDGYSCGYGTAIYDGVLVCGPGVGIKSECDFRVSLGEPDAIERWWSAFVGRIDLAELDHVGIVNSVTRATLPVFGRPSLEGSK